MNNLAEICYMGMGLGGNYLRFPVIVLFRMGVFGAASGGGGAGPKRPPSLKSITDILQ